MLRIPRPFLKLYPNNPFDPKHYGYWFKKLWWQLWCWLMGIQLSIDWDRGGWVLVSKSYFSRMQYRTSPPPPPPVCVCVCVRVTSEHVQDNCMSAVVALHQLGHRFNTKLCTWFPSRPQTPSTTSQSCFPPRTKVTLLDTTFISNL